jgi:hypothetical protein
MSFTTFWAYAIGILVVWQILALGLVGRHQRTRLPEGERQTSPRRVGAFKTVLPLVTGIWFVAAVVTRFTVGGPPTFVDNIRSGRISAELVQCVQIVEEPTSEGHERILAEVRERQEISVCLNALATSSVGIKHRNHPESLYRGGLRVVTEDGTSHLIPFFVMRYKGERFAYYYSFHNRDYDWDQNCYESTNLVPFLARHDPRFPK